MIVLFGSTCGPVARQRFMGRKNLGTLHSPTAWRTPWCPYACDNDVYAAWQKSHNSELSAEERAYWRDYWEPGGIGEARWRKMLEKIPAEQPPLFVVLPDIVADWEGTLRRAYQYRDALRSRNLPMALALQDGCRFEEAQDFAPEWVFIGGTTAWKWANAPRACKFFQPQGIRVHVGRAGGPDRITACLKMGADSCDSTGWGRYADKMLPGLWRALDSFEAQHCLAL